MRAAAQRIGDAALEIEDLAFDANQFGGQLLGELRVDISGVGVAILGAIADRRAVAGADRRVELELRDVAREPDRLAQERSDLSCLKLDHPAVVQAVGDRPGEQRRHPEGEGVAVPVADRQEAVLDVVAQVVAHRLVGPALSEQLAAVGDLLRTATARNRLQVVQDAAVTEPHAVALLAEAQAQVHVLERVAVPGVESVRVLERLAPDEHACGGHGLELARLADGRMIGGKPA